MPKIMNVCSGAALSIHSGWEIAVDDCEAACIYQTDAWRGMGVLDYEVRGNSTSRLFCFGAVSNCCRFVPMFSIIPVGCLQRRETVRA